MFKKITYYSFFRVTLLIGFISFLNIFALSQVTKTIYQDQFDGTINVDVPDAILSQCNNCKYQNFLGTQAGSAYFYLNHIDGGTGLMFDRPLSLILGVNYSFSMYYKNTFLPVPANYTFTMRNGTSGASLGSITKTDFANNTWKQATFNFVGGASNNVQLSTTSPGFIGGNDNGFDTLVITHTGPTVTISNTAPCPSLSTTLSSTLTGSPTHFSSPSYQWQDSTDGGTTWNNISGATSSTLTVSNLSSSFNNRRYRLLVAQNSAAMASTAHQFISNVINLGTISCNDLTLSKSHTGNFTVGSTGNYSFTVTNSGGIASAGTITVTDTLPTGLTVNGGAAGAVTDGGTNAANWSCSSNATSPQVVTCTSTTAIAAGANNVFNFNVNVGASTPVGTNSITNTATVSGGGESVTTNNSANDPTTVLFTDLTINKSHTGNFAINAIGNYSFTVSNGGSASSSGTITVTDTLPTGLTVNGGAAGAITEGGANAANWTCNSNAATPQVVTCTSTTAIAPSSSSTFSFPVTVGTSTPTGTNSITNTATVSGGGEINTTNNSASDPTTVNPLPPTTMPTCSGSRYSIVNWATDFPTIDTPRIVTRFGITSNILVTRIPNVNGYTGSFIPYTAAYGSSYGGTSITEFGHLRVTTTFSTPLPTARFYYTDLDGNESGRAYGLLNGVIVTPSVINGPSSATMVREVLPDGSVRFYPPVFGTAGDEARAVIVGFTSPIDTLVFEHDIRPDNQGAQGSAVATNIETCVDLSDAPASYGDVAHSVGNFTIGSVIDGDNASLANATATGDDTNNTDDEEGVASFPVLTNAAAQTYTVPVNVTNASGTSYLVGYIDFNRDGDFNDTGEKSATVTVTSSGSKNVVFTTPAGMTAGATFARFRLGATQSQVESPTTGALYGEVEDYQLTIVTPTDLTLAKSHTGNFTVGSTGTYTLTATNSGGTASSGAITITDTLPTGLTVTDGALALSGANSANWTCNAASNVITCTSSTAIAASGTSIFNFNVNVGLGTAVGTNSITNTANISGGGDANTANNSASDPTTVLSPNLTIAKTDSGVNFTVGSTGTYQLTVGNSGTSATTGTITISDTLPTGLTVPNGALTLAGTNAANWSCSAASNVITCTSSTAIATSGSSVFTFNINVGLNAPLGTNALSNTATISGGGEATANNGNNSSTDTTSVLSPNLTIDKTHSGNFQQGLTGNYSIAIGNSGTVATTGTITVSDTLPTGLTIANGAVTLNGTNAANWTCNAASNVITCTSSTAIAISGTSTFGFTVNVASNAPATLNNTATVSGGNEATANNGNNSDTDTVAPITPPNVQLVKSCPSPANCTTAPQLPGTELTYQIQFTNTGGAAAANMTIVDGIPANTDFKVSSATSNVGTTGLTIVIEYSNNYDPLNPSLATWIYTPVSGGGGASTGYDRNVKAIRWRTTAGTLSNVSPNNTGNISFITKIQ